METALYIQHKKAPLPLQVIAEREDGTVDLGDLETGELRVAGCRITDEPEIGAAVLKLTGGDGDDGEPKASPVEVFLAKLESGEEVTEAQLVDGLKAAELEDLAERLGIEASGTKAEIAAAILAD